MAHPRQRHRLGRRAMRRSLTQWLVQGLSVEVLPRRDYANDYRATGPHPARVSRGEAGPSDHWWMNDRGQGRCLSALRVTYAKPWWLWIAAFLVSTALLGCGFRESDHLADELRQDPMLQEDLGVDGFEAGEVGTTTGAATGMVVVGRVFTGPVGDVQQHLESRAAAAGWSAIDVGCGTDRPGFVLHANRIVGDRPASLDITVSRVNEKTRVHVDVSARVEGGNRLGTAPVDPPEQCR